MVKSKSSVLMFGQTPPVGLDLGEASLRAVSARNTSRGPRITAWTQRTIPPDLRDDGETTSFVTGALENMWSEGHFRTRRVFCCVPKTLARVHFLALPEMAPRDLRGAVEMELRKMVSFDLEDGVYDFTIVGPTGHEGRIGVIAAAAPRAALDRVVQSVEDAGLQIVGLTIAPCAIENAVRYAGVCAGGKTAAVLDIGYGGTMISVFRHGRLLFARDIGACGRDIIKALARKILIDDETVELSPQDAENVLRNRNVLNPRNPSSQLSAAVRPVIERMVSQTKRSFVYFRQVFKNARIDRVCVTGGLSKLKGLREHLTEQLESEVDVLAPVRESAMADGVLEGRSFKSIVPDMAVPAGLPLDAERKIDLITGALRIRNAVERVKPMFGIAVLSALCVFLLISSAMFFTARSYERVYLPGRRGTLATLGPVVERVRTYRQLREAVAAKREGLHKLEERLPLWEGILREMSHVVPGDVVLTEMKPVVDPARRTQAMSIRGLIYSERRNKTLSELISLLRKSPFFEDVLSWDVQPPLPVQEGDVPGLSRPASFELKCSLVY